MQVLLVEDDVVQRELLGTRLRAEGFAVDEADTIKAAESALDAHDYDCLVLDRLLPDGDAVDLVARRHDRLPGGHDAVAEAAAVLFLTARNDPADILAGFVAGADDYLTKPVNFYELVARLRVLCRRDRRPVPSRCRWADMVVDRATGSAVRDGVLLPLTPKEFALLEVLVDAGGDVVTNEDLFERCWDAGADMFSNAVYVHMASLQQKLGPPPIIRSVRGVGYALQAPSPP